MFDRHILKFDIYYYNIETPTITALLHFAREHNVIIHKIKKTGTIIYSYKIIVYGCSRGRFLKFVENFLDYAGSNINHPSFK